MLLKDCEYIVQESTCMLEETCSESVLVGGSDRCSYCIAVTIQARLLYLIFYNFGFVFNYQFIEKEVLGLRQLYMYALLVA